MIVVAFFWISLFWFLPPYLLGRKRGFFSLLIYHVAISGFLFNLLSLFKISSLGAFCFTLSLSLIFLPFYPKKGKALSKQAVLLSFVVLLDLFFILHKNQWQSTGGHPYFRPPIHSDNVRNAVVIENLNSSFLSPYLPNTPLRYPIFWHQTVRLLLTPFSSSHEITILPMVHGATLATAFLFLVLLISMLGEKIKNTRTLIFLLGILFFHADLLHLFSNFILNGKWGIEADWSTTAGFLRYYSWKLLFLSSPQHVLFLFFTLAYLRFRTPLALFTAFFAAPTLWILFFGIYFGHHFLSHPSRNTFIKPLATLVGVLLVYRVIFGTFPIESYIPTGKGASVTKLPSAINLLYSPLFYVGTLGVLGLLLTFHFFKELRSGTLRWDWKLTNLLLAIPPLYFFADHPELRRHLSILLLIPATFSILPLVQKKLFTPTSQFCLFSIGLVCHLYFLLCYLQKPSILSTTVPWNDYLRMNVSIKEHYRNHAIMAASDPWKLGLEMPIVMEIAPSFSLPEHALIHSKVSEQKIRTLDWIFSTREYFGVAQDLGFSFIEWGPAEELLWGKKIRDRFIKETPPILTAGTVGLYPFRDHLRHSLAPLSNFDKATAFEKQGWDWEAVIHYHQSLNEFPQHKPALEAVVRLYHKLGYPQLAEPYEAQLKGATGNT